MHRKLDGAYCFMGVVWGSARIARQVHVRFSDSFENRQFIIIIVVIRNKAYSSTSHPCSHVCFDLVRRIGIGCHKR